MMCERSEKGALFTTGTSYTLVLEVAKQAKPKAWTIRGDQVDADCQQFDDDNQSVSLASDANW